MTPVAPDGYVWLVPRCPRHDQRLIASSLGHKQDGSRVALHSPDYVLFERDARVLPLPLNNCVHPASHPRVPTLGHSVHMRRESDSARSSLGTHASVCKDYVGNDGSARGLWASVCRFNSISGPESSQSGFVLRDFMPIVGEVGVCAKFNAKGCMASALPYVIPSCERVHACVYCLDPHAVDDCPQLAATFESLREKVVPDLQSKLHKIAEKKAGR